MSILEKALKKAVLDRAKKKSAQDIDGKIVDNKADDNNRQIISTSSELNAPASSGHIPAMQEQESRNKSSLAARKIIYPDMANGKVVDQFREIRTHIYQSLRQISTPILVTAVSGNAGNTFVIKNISAAIALDDAKTSLIVDCNLANPGFKDLLTDEKHLGVTDYIESGISIEEIIQAVGINRMRLIPAGAKKESVTDYLTSNRLRTLFSELQERYADRVILVDSPSIKDFADAKILTNLFSHVILVVPYRKVTENQIANAVKSIGKEKIIGIVINREPRFLSLFNFFIK
ncbi:hypothetical protein MNBD_GAMMA12-3574 [hydrothermal vent metagenome]|uniref:Uncharacterized protein n=1 Tax=hydrothermal vent metagenome TaxID=652676 RepID=A0A3B0XT64_9ZZZZ